MKIYQEIVNSSAIAGFEYDTETEILSVRFTSGDKMYDYVDIPEEVVQKWMNAESVGKYFHKYIAGA